ncbi:MAG: presqualene diphosphate synthase HpnD [Gammaproteobacteria bacterium]|nr:presqualene diphosphate synthase HpnD [Gammaproteobacteria bacterium]
MTPDQYCQEKTAKSGSSFYYSFLFLPEQKRKAIMALYAFCREVDDVVDEIHEEQVARVKLNWWRDEVQRIFHGVPQHPVGLALKPQLENFRLDEKYFYDIIDGMQMDLDFNHYLSFNDLSGYCYRAASAVGLLTVEIFGYSNKLTLRYAHDLGMAFQLTNILRDVREDARRHRVYIPEDECRQFNVTTADFLQAKTPDNVRELFKFQADRARKFYQQALQHLPDEDRYNQRSGIIMKSIYESLLDEIELDGFRVLEHQIKLTPLRKIWLAWQTARKEKKRHKKLRKAHG